MYPQIEKPIVLATGLLAEAALDQITKHLAVESWLLLRFILTKQTKVSILDQRCTSTGRGSWMIQGL